MKISDAFVLAYSKLSIRRTRTFIAILTSSVLFGFIILILFLFRGLTSGLDRAADSFGDSGRAILVGYGSLGFNDPRVMEKAKSLYNASNDPDKRNPMIDFIFDGEVVATNIDKENPFAIEAMNAFSSQQRQESSNARKEMIESYDGKAISELKIYGINNNSVYIDKISPSKDPDEYISGNASTYNYPHVSDPGILVATASDDLFLPFIKKTEKRNDVVQIVVFLDEAAKLMDIKFPTLTGDSNPDGIDDYINEVNSKAIGHTFTGTISSGDGATSTIEYEIVGLFPSKLFPRAVRSADFIENVLSYFTSNSLVPFSFAVTNPESSAFKSAYSENGHEGDSYSAALFESDENLYKISDQYMGETNSRIKIEDFISPRLSKVRVSNAIDNIVAVFTAIFVSIAIIVMVGSVGRIIDDERSNIALYRSIGATGKNIVQIFASYIFILCLMIICLSLLLAFLAAAVLTFIFGHEITANISAIHNTPNMFPVILVGFDFRILFVSFAIFCVGAICLLLVIDRIIAKNIVRDLRLR